MSIANEPIFVWMSQFAYEPNMVYFGIVGMMLLSAVGFPLPEEVTFISVGILAFMGANPQMFPPPYDGAPVVNANEAALISLVAVIFADFLIYTIGRVWGRRLLHAPRFSRFFPPSIIEKVERWTAKYGAYACGIFRFTPGIRFPGHIACGMMKYPAWKFALIDGAAALISVPTQILLLAHYGEPILIKLKQFKTILLFLILIAIVAFIVFKWRERRQKSALV